MRTFASILLSLGILAGVTPGTADAQIELRTPGIQAEVGGRVHLQFATTSVDGPPSTQFLIRRARLNFSVTLNDWITGRIQPEFGLGSAKVRDAWIRLGFSPGFRVTFGQFKVPFDLFQLTSSTETLVIERTGVVTGAGSCPGVVFCSYSTISAGLILSDRDIGVMVDGTSGKFYYGVSVTNGTGQVDLDDNGTKSFTGRVAVEVAPDVSVGVNAAMHDFLNDTTAASEYAPAAGADLDVGNFTEGLHFRLGIIVGENWRNLDAGGNTSTFVTGQGIISYKIPVTNNRYIEAVEPLGRLSWAEADTDATGSSRALLITPGVQVFFTGRNKVALNIDIYDQDQMETQVSVKAQVYFYF